MSGDLEVLKEIPGYKAILKSVLKSQIQMLVEQLSEHTGEETILLTASLHDGTLSHQGSSTGKGFLEGRDEIKSQFLGYCLKSHHKKKSSDTRPSPYQRPQTSGRISPALGSPSKKAPRLQVQPVSLQRVVPGENTGTPNSNKRPADVQGASSQVFTSDSSAEQSSVSVKLESNESGVSSGDSENLTTTTTFPSSIHQNHTLTAGDISASENNDSQNNADNYTEISTMNDDSSTANTCIKIEPITENEMELEITGVEPGKVNMQSDSWSHSPSGFSITPTSVVEASSFSNETNDSSYNVWSSLKRMIGDKFDEGHKSLHRRKAPAHRYISPHSSLRTNSIVPAHSKGDSSLFHKHFPPGPGHHQNVSTDSPIDFSQSITPAKVKRVQCEFCLKWFAGRGVLNRHLLIHSGERPWQCSQCEKSFNRKATLKQHMLQHLQLNENIPPVQGSST